MKNQNLTVNFNVIDDLDVSVDSLMLLLFKFDVGGIY